MARKQGDIKGYCDCLYRELSSMKDSLGGLLTEIDLMGEREKKALHSHVKHLNDLIEAIDWKIEIFAKECPVEWGALGKESESSTSVPSTESLKEKDFPSGGYAGG